MGPTRFFPRTHDAPSVHQTHDDYGLAALLPTLPCCDAVVPRGAATLYDSRLLHCGRANEASRAATSAASSAITSTGPSASADASAGAGQSSSVSSSAGEAGDATRVLFYLTFRHVLTDDSVGEVVNEAAHSIRPEYAGRLTLGQCRGKVPWPSLH